MINCGAEFFPTFLNIANVHSMERVVIFVAFNVHGIFAIFAHSLQLSVKLSDAALIHYFRTTRAKSLRWEA